MEMKGTSTKLFTPEQATILFNAAIKHFRKKDDYCTTILCDIGEDLSPHLRDMFNSLLDFGAKIENTMEMQVLAFNLFGNILSDVNLMKKLIPMCDMSFFETIILYNTDVPSNICLGLNVAKEVGEVLVDELMRKSKLNAAIAYAKTFGTTTKIADAIKIKLDNKEADTFLMATAYGDVNLAKKALDAGLTKDGFCFGYNHGFSHVLEDKLTNILSNEDEEMIALLLTPGIIDPKEVYLRSNLFLAIMECNTKMVDIFLKFDPSLTLGPYDKNEIMTHGDEEAIQLFKSIFPEA